MKFPTRGAALLAAFAALPAQGASDTAALQARIEAMEQQIQSLRRELQRVNARAEEANARTEVLASHQENTASPQSAAAQAGQTSLFGYGELAYSRPRQDASRAQADVRRAVIGIGHRFNDRMKLVSEYEFEHAVTSRDDRGEAAVEQLYLDYRLDERMNLKAGLFLMPLGLLNESHEPTSFHGVQRNEVETRILPTTWREIGVGLYGALDSGMQYDLGMSTGFSLAKWDPASGPSAPLAALHQEGQMAAAHDLAFYGALHYLPLPGLRLGGGLWSGNAAQGNGAFRAGSGGADLSGIAGRITLMSLDASWQTGKLDLRALYARGHIGEAGAVNEALAGTGLTSGFMPASFDGGYVQAAYRLFERGDLALTPFLRWERFDTQKDMPSGFSADPLHADRVITAGASLFLTRNAVFKADYQKFGANTGKDSLNLGLGFAF